jgi:hypothetical protein
MRQQIYIPKTNFSIQQKKTHSSQTSRPPLRKHIWRLLGLYLLLIIFLIRIDAPQVRAASRAADQASDCAAALTTAHLTIPSVAPSAAQTSSSSYGKIIQFGDFRIRLLPGWERAPKEAEKEWGAWLLGDTTSEQNGRTLIVSFSFETTDFSRESQKTSGWENT